MDILRLVGRTIVSTRVDRYGNETLILDDRTELYSGDQGCFGIQMTYCEVCSATLMSEDINSYHNQCATCRQRVNQEFADRIAKEQQAKRTEAVKDTPALAALRSQLEN